MGDRDEHVELLRRQYLQLLDPDTLTLPPRSILKQPHIQAQIFTSMFREDAMQFPPPDRYKSRVLKLLVKALEAAIDDPDEDVREYAFPNRQDFRPMFAFEISDDLTECLAEFLATPLASDVENAQKKCYVTYSAPGPLYENATIITTLESPSLLAAAGTTGLRTWEAAKFLATYLFSSDGKTRVSGKSVIELGAGTGLVSMLCAKHLNARFVLSTDGTGEVVDDLMANLYLNQLDGHKEIEAVVLKWGHAITTNLVMDEDGTRGYNLVLGADIIFDDRLILPLVSTLHELFERYSSMQGLISATIRKEDTVAKFLQACAAHNFTVRALCSSLDHATEQQTGFFLNPLPEIKIFELTRRAKS